MEGKMEIKSYSYRIAGGSPAPHAWESRGSSKFTPRSYVMLLDDSFSVIGYVVFISGGEDIPEDYVSSGIIYMFLPKSDLVSAIDMLRNEEPVHLSFSSRGSRAILSTWLEEVGEGEL